MPELEALRFAQVIHLNGVRYKVVRRWNGASVQVRNIFAKQESLALYYGSDGRVVVAAQPPAAGFSF